MNLEQLGYAVEVAKARSFSAASKRLFLSQSAVSQAVMNLEEELGVKLYLRTKSGASVTPEGSLLIAKAEEILNKVDELKLAARRQQGANAAEPAE
ncbi:LysR family transcriptional regulator [Paenibacillus protaetiae]|uniref:LysR family transcriptional regulator n=1 Tax=Paenibacillus protaetiae TaxID=2509456 RepID=A0A4P6ETX3_9BACL|nr:LysR family transcriptional regulator [Paenibacillus protaetiae]QAY65523.1 LysR family transcriptional regulator [Paenibacillus protaetiae]